MDRHDYTTLVSHFIPNEVTYHFIFSIHVLAQYNGVENLDVTLDDNLTYHILQPILDKQIEYNFELIWKEDQRSPVQGSIDICVKVNQLKFEPKLVIDNLERHKMLAGLELFKEEYNELIKIY